MQKRSAAAQISRCRLHRCITRVLSLVLCFVVVVSMVAAPSQAHAGIFDNSSSSWWSQLIANWIYNNSSTSNTWNTVDNSNTNYTVNKPQNYYTTVTSSVVDKSGNVTNYYRGGDTTNTNIIDSYNRTFNTIYNTTNNSTTNQYSANVKLENFLNTYTTNNVTTNNTYSANFKSWYYDNTTNNYNYNEFNKYDTTNNYLYYNQDNSRYYISIDNSTDEYYLIDVQYSPTFVTVNYTYNTTNNNYGDKVGDVTNVYYYELKDGRNSSSLTAAEVAGMDFGYDVANYELVTDDPNTLSLQHFDGDYTDSSSYNRTFYSQNRSNSYVDSGAFGQAVSLPNGSAAGVTIPNLSSNSKLTFDFRVYFNDISSLEIYFGDANIFQRIPDYRSWTATEIYDDNSTTGMKSSTTNGSQYQQGSNYSKVLGEWSTVLKSSSGTPTTSTSSGYQDVFTENFKVGYMTDFSVPALFKRTYTRYDNCYSVTSTPGPDGSYQIYGFFFKRTNKASVEYRSTPTAPVSADFSYDTYRNQWVSMRITISGGKLYYFVNGDLVGSGTFTKPTADKFYIKSSGTVYLDELRVTTGSLSSTSTYNPSSAPYDTNKVLALPDDLIENTIYVQHNIKVSNLRVGGVRPSNPTVGFLYIPLYDDRTAAQPQLYDGSNWIDVTAMVYNGNTIVNVFGYKFSPVGDSPDVDLDAKPERPVKPGDTVDPDTCTHDWEVTGGTQPTCALSGNAEYTCSKCGKTKTETISKLPHNWEVKQTVQTSYDESGEIITQGFTIYRCTSCGEEYKDSDGSGPPGGSSSGGEGGGSLLDKLGELLGAGAGGFLKLVAAFLGGILDGLISLVNVIVEKLGEVIAAVNKIFTEVPQLFSGFLAFLSAIFPFLPAEIMLLLTFGLAAVVFVGIIKAIRR